MYDDMFNRANSRPGKRGYDSSLSAEQRADLDSFVEWLQAEGKTEGTSRSYRSHLAKAMAKPEAEITNDMASAIRAFQKFLKDS